ncbi:MAG: hypothetical protein ACYCV4_18940 [Dermatophilaceae bacterium]
MRSRLANALAVTKTIPEAEQCTVTICAGWETWCAPDGRTDIVDAIARAFDLTPASEYAVASGTHYGTRFNSGPAVFCVNTRKP